MTLQIQKLRFTSALGQSVTLDEKPAFILNEVEGLGDVTVTDQVSKGVYQHGDSYLSSLMDARHIHIKASILTQSPADLFKQRHYFAQVFNPILDLGLLTYEGPGVIREIECKPTHVPQFPAGKSNRSPVYQRAIVELYCPNPFWRDERMTSVFIENGRDIEFENNGDLPSYVVIKIMGPVTNPTVTVVDTGEFMKVNGEIKFGETLRIRTKYGDKQVDLTDANGKVFNRFSWIDLQSTFFQLPRGKSTLKATYEGSGIIEIWYYRHYVSV
jgi:Phage tail protein